MDLVASILGNARLDHNFKEAAPASLTTVIGLRITYILKGLFSSPSYHSSSYRTTTSWNPVKILGGATHAAFSSTSGVLRGVTGEGYYVVREITLSLIETVKRITLLGSPFYRPKPLLNTSLIRLIGVLAIAALAAITYVLLNRKPTATTTPYETEQRKPEEYGKRLDYLSECKTQQYKHLDLSEFDSALKEIQRLNSADPKTFRINPEIEFLDLGRVVQMIEGYGADTEEDFSEKALFSFNGTHFFVSDQDNRQETVKVLNNIKRRESEDSLTDHEKLALKYIKVIARYIIRKNSVYSKMEKNNDSKSHYINLVDRITKKIVDGVTGGCVDQSLSQLEEVLLMISLFHQGNQEEQATTANQFGLLLNQYRLSLIKELIQTAYPHEAHAADLERQIKRIVLQDLNIPAPLVITVGAQFTKLWGEGSATLHETRAQFIKERFLEQNAPMQWLVDHTSHSYGRAPNIALGQWLDKTYRYDRENSEHREAFALDPSQEKYNYDYSKGTTLFFLLRSRIIIPRDEDMHYHENRLRGNIKTKVG